MSGTAHSSKYLHQIARTLGTTPEYLTGETDDPSPDAIGEQRRAYHGPAPDEAEVSGTVWIKEADQVLGLGGSYLDHHVDEKRVPFPADWLRQYTNSPPELLVFMRGKGTSMDPTISDGDICLLDLGRKRLDEQDELWACVYGQLGMVKRLRAMPDGSVKIMSDNPAVSDELASDGELWIIGRCCGVFGKK